MPRGTQHDMDNPISIVEFCAGYGGLGLGIKRVLGERLRAVAYCELEGFAQANLVSKMEAGHLDAAPIWTDLLTFPYQDFHGLVDIAAAGIPCQPHSLAGKRAGGSDKRFLFGDWLDGLEKMRPRLIFIENVEGFLSSHMPDGTLCVTYTVERLEKMGYRVEAGVFSAAEVGAPHQRKRVFILAVAHEFVAGLEGLTGHVTDRDQPGRVDAEAHGPACTGGVWPSRPGEPQHEWEPPRVVGNASLGQDDGREPGDVGGAQQCGQRGDDAAGCASEGVGDPASRGLGIERDASRSERGGHADGTDAGVADTSSLDRRGREPRTGRREWGTVDAAAGHEGVVGQAESPLGGDTDGSPGRLDYAELCQSCDSRTDELRLLGNGVVPATAAKAFATLMGQLQ